MDIYGLAILLFVFTHARTTSQSKVRACEPPKNIDALPSFAQEELRNTWSNYKKGEPCEGQLLITDDILAVVDIFAHSYSTSSPYDPHGAESARVEGRPYRLSKTDTDRRESTGSSDRRTSDQRSSHHLKEHQQSSLRSSARDSSNSNDDHSISVWEDPSSLPSDYGDYLDENFQSSSGAKRSSTTSEMPSGDRSLIKDSASVGGRQGMHADDGIDFLKSVDPEVREAFENTMNDPDIPSEGLRREKVHLLAVSLLNADQLLAYNKYATERRKRARAQHAELAKISNEARRAFGVIARAEPTHQHTVANSFPAKVRRELKNFVIARSRKHA